MLAAFGTPALLAVKIGGLWYLAMLAVGTVIAGRLARQTKNAAFLACVPPAFAVFGGTFIHITQIAAALPAALLLAEYARGEYRTLAVIALLVLSVPWGWTVSAALILGPLVPVAFLAYRYWSANISAVLLAGVLAAVMILGLQQLYLIHGIHLGSHTPVPAIDSRLAEASWSAYSQRTSNNSVAAWAVRIPTWGGLIVLLGLLTLQARAVAVMAGRPLSYLSRGVS